MSHRKNPFSLAPGDKVVHRSLTDTHGTAKTGSIQAGVDDALVIAEWRDESAPVAFDRRELERLVMVPGLSRGPLLLYPRHVWGLFVSCLRYAFGRTQPAA